MSESRIQEKLKHLLQRLSELEEALGKPDAFADPKRYKSLTQEHAYLAEVRSTNEKLVSCRKRVRENEEMLQLENDPDFISIIKEDLGSAAAQATEWEKKLTHLLIPPDPNDHRNTILELRAGTGGDEAALFVGDCVRMYKLFADRQEWTYEHLSSAPSELGGFKEYIMALSGNNVHRFLQYEGGTHRVQRVPDTEAQGRIHTSAITIAVLLEPDEEEDIELDPKDLRFDTYRSSGAGGQHVNTTDSAVRITYLPTGLAVYCQEERSQHKNRDKALRLLKAKLIEMEREKKSQELADKRAIQVGSGDRSERIRTYNFPQNRVTDHRINLTLYSLDRVMEGNLTDLVDALVAYFHQEEL